MENNKLTFDSENESETNSLPNHTLDGLVARGTLALSQMTISRRNFLGKVAKIALAVTGASLIKVLPIDRESPVAEAGAPNCSSWYMCYIAANRTCQCACGANSCPTSPQTYKGSKWDGCCYNPDGFQFKKVYYWDCCGATTGCCANSTCVCANPPGHTEPFWCGGISGGYCCTYWKITNIQC